MTHTKESIERNIGNIVSKWQTNSNNVPKGSSEARDIFISKFGFTLYSSDLQSEISKIVKLLEVKTFVEPMAGLGFLTCGLIDIGLTGKGVTLNDFKSWGLERGVVTDFLINNELLKIANVGKYEHPEVDMIALSWVPYNEDSRDIRNFINRTDHKYLLLIGEHYGCTGDVEFAEYVDDSYEEAFTFNSYETFNGLHDTCVLYKRVE